MGVPNGGGVSFDVTGGKETPKVEAEAAFDMLEEMRTGARRRYPTDVARVVMRSAVVHGTMESFDKMLKLPGAVVLRKMRERARAVSSLDDFKTRYMSVKKIRGVV